MTTTPPTSSARNAPTKPATSPRGLQHLFAPVDIGLIVVFRVAFGCCMLIEVGRYFAKGWIDTQFVDPALHFHYYGFSWVHPLPGLGMHVVFALLGASAALMAVGLLYRAASILFCLLFTYIFLIDQTWYLNHFYLIVLLSLISIVLPANRAWSVDAWLRPAIRSQTVPAWSLWLLRFQIAIPYVYGGIAKLHADWLAGVPMQIMMGSGERYPLLGPYFDVDAVVLGFAWGGLLFDLLIVPLLLWGPTRVPAYIAAILFHASNARMFRIGIFPLVMVAASMVFFPADSLRPEQSARPPQPGEPPHLAATLTRRQRWFVAMLSLFVAWQLLMPLRHFLYPGNVNWTEEGHRFSWHMKLRTKTATAVFHAHDENGRELTDFTPPDQVLHPRQLAVMSERPDMLLQYAHRIADELRAQGHQHVAVRAEVQASLNGRRPQPLIDPAVNLAAQPRNLRHSTWIVPLTEPRPSLAEVRRARPLRTQVEERGAVPQQPAELEE